MSYAPYFLIALSYLVITPLIFDVVGLRHWSSIIFIVLQLLFFVVMT